MHRISNYWLFTGNFLVASGPRQNVRDIQDEICIQLHLYRIITVVQVASQESKQTKHYLDINPASLNANSHYLYISQMPTTTLLTLLTLLAACAINITSASAAHERSYFYVGGNYTLTSDGGQIFTNQMYVERLVPAGGVLREYPIVFVHGNGQTGTVCVHNWRLKRQMKLTTIELVE